MRRNLDGVGAMDDGDAMTFDPSKPLQTRDGRPVELIATNARGLQPLIGYIGNSLNLAYWGADGSNWPSRTPSYQDLVNAPEPRVFYLCIGNEMILPADHADGNYRITLCEGCEPKIEEVK